jgi:hypothetical protein
MIPRILSGEVLQWYIICVLADSFSFHIYIIFLVTKNDKELLSIILVVMLASITRDDNLVSNVRRCRHTKGGY